MHNTEDEIQKQAREVESFLDGLAKQIKAFEDKTGHKLAMNAIVRIEGDENNHFPFAYCRAADVTCPSCGDIHNGDEAIQAAFVNTWDIDTDLSPWPIDRGDTQEAFDKCVRKYDFSLPMGGPDAFVVRSGDAVYNSAGKASRQGDQKPDPDAEKIVNLVKSALGDDLIGVEVEQIGDVKGMSGGVVDLENAPEPLRKIAEAIKAAGGEVKVVRLTRGSDSDDAIGFDGSSRTLH